MLDKELWKRLAEKTLGKGSESTKYLDRALAYNNEVSRLDLGSYDKILESESLVPWMLR